MRSRTVVALVAVLVSVLLAACAPAATTASSAPASKKQNPAIVVEQPWVRTTSEAKDQTMTGAFMSISNPRESEVRLVAASSEIAGTTEIHEMVMVDGKSVMQKATNGVAIKSGEHVHLKPGGYHVMLMKLTKSLAIGDEVTINLEFSDGTKQSVKAPVKKYTEEEDHYHSSAPTGAASTPAANTTTTRPTLPSMPSVTAVKTIS